MTEPLAQDGSPRLVSIVVPALNEYDNVPAVLERMVELGAAHPAYAFELVLVDDGSSDGTAERVIADAPPGVPVTVVQLSRSFGSHQAITAGLRRTSGDCAIVLGADIQEPPELIAEFLVDVGGRAPTSCGEYAAPGSVRCVRRSPRSCSPTCSPSTPTSPTTHRKGRRGC